tara:strand:- start:721 stop:1551 length:831 start_codon:yes stop_codon:yes gene_type:complete
MNLSQEEIENIFSALKPLYKKIKQQENKQRKYKKLQKKVKKLKKIVKLQKETIKDLSCDNGIILEIDEVSVLNDSDESIKSDNISSTDIPEKKNKIVTLTERFISDLSQYEDDEESVEALSYTEETEQELNIQYKVKKEPESNEENILQSVIKDKTKKYQTKEENQDNNQEDKPKKLSSEEDQEEQSEQQHHDKEQDPVEQDDEEEDPEEQDDEEEDPEEQDNDEEDEEEELFELTINNVEYYVSNEKNGPVYEILESEEPGDEIGKLINGKLNLY